MSFDIEQVLKDMTGAITDAVKAGTGDISAAVQQILDTEKASLQELGEARLKGEIDDTVFDREIEREKKVVEAELLTIEIMTKALAQKAVNAAIDVFVKAVKAAF
jgi:hypothetical protein